MRHDRLLRTMSKPGAKTLARLAVLATALGPTVALAHTGVAEAGWLHGFVHPFTGIDHLFAMLAVGLWAAQRGGSARLWIPLAFVGAMLLGGVLGMAGMVLPFAEQGILASLLVLGLLVAVAARLPLTASMALVAAFAMFHGHAHGAEMPAGVSGFGYAAGFVAATALLHAVGVAAGMAGTALQRLPLLRAGGLAVAGYGAFMLVA